jgi:hypothetical protein
VIYEFGKRFRRDLLADDKKSMVFSVSRLLRGFCWDLVTLKDLLGHSRLKMVLRYAHASEQNKVEAIRRMEKNTDLIRKTG